MEEVEEANGGGVTLCEGGGEAPQTRAATPPVSPPDSPPGQAPTDFRPTFHNGLHGRLQGDPQVLDSVSSSGAPSLPTRPSPSLSYPLPLLSHESSDCSTNIDA